MYYNSFIVCWAYPMQTVGIICTCSSVRWYLCIDQAMAFIRTTGRSYVRVIRAVVKLPSYDSSKMPMCIFLHPYIVKPMVITRPEHVMIWLATSSSFRPRESLGHEHSCAITPHNAIQVVTKQQCVKPQRPKSSHCTLKKALNTDIQHTDERHPHQSPEGKKTIERDICIGD
ncbi:uncharacterized protein EDB91DRAFT_811407 [Suillus paluster]|uniref:uncharacterized protein n=1 Tax=Suillus paluster TaxID=48578 RepID=UPI001B85B615|nr:uncharacterized protein EDB91DRAFT_811407 [Suillus paluster]KAG1729516.1 hypothetical protein EDB91DRAFT_811407 [Suillus paluster]